MTKEEAQADVIKLLIEKVALTTSRFIKGEINEATREAIYDEVYLGFKQLLSKKKRTRTKLVEVTRWREPSLHPGTEYEL